MYLLNTIFLIATTHFSLNYFFKEQYMYFLYNMSYIMLYNLSKVEIVIKQYYANIMQNYYVAKLLDTLEDYYVSLKTYDTELIVSNVMIEQIKIENLLYFYDYSKLKDVDFFIYTKSVEKNEKENKFILYDISDLSNIIVPLKKCEYQFLSMNIKIKNPDNENFDLHLDSKRETYYVINNRLNVIFFSYLLKSKYGISSNALTLRYDIQIIDQNANICNISECDELILFKDYYQIIPYDYEKSMMKKFKNYNNYLLSLNLTSNNSVFNNNLENEEDEEDVEDKEDKFDDSSYVKVRK